MLTSALVFLRCLVNCYSLLCCLADFKYHNNQVMEFYLQHLGTFGIIWYYVQYSLTFLVNKYHLQGHPHDYN